MITCNVHEAMNNKSIEIIELRWNSKDSHINENITQVLWRIFSVPNIVTYRFKRANLALSILGNLIKLEKSLN